jgi:hypothetical protein
MILGLKRKKYERPFEPNQNKTKRKKEMKLTCLCPQYDNLSVKSVEGEAKAQVDMD